MGPRQRLPAAWFLWVICLLEVLKRTQAARLPLPLHGVFPHPAAFVPPSSCNRPFPTASTRAKQREVHVHLSAKVDGNGGISYPFHAVERHWMNYYSQRSAEFSPALPLPSDTAEIRPNSIENKAAGDEKYYVLSMIPYPSGSGLHMGHCYTYTLADVAARYQRLKLRAAMQRQQRQKLDASATLSPGPIQNNKATETWTDKPFQPNVLHVIGWDSFGLPAEQHAREKGEAPAFVVEANIKTFRQQLQRLGISVDWRREITTSDPNFFRWTQWGFLQMLKRGLAYEAYADVNWCPALGTVLANEELTKEGLSERGGFPVECRRLRQWHLRLRAYAERLLAGLSLVDWPADVLQMQRKWIGRVVYIQLKLEKAQGGDSLSCLLSAPEYIFGCTGVVVHPLHPLAAELAASSACREKVERSLSQTKTGSQQKTPNARGVHTGVYVNHPVTNRPLPVVISDVMEALPEFGLQLSEADALLVCPSHQPFAASLVDAGLLPLAPVSTHPSNQRKDDEIGDSEEATKQRRQTTDDERIVNSCIQGLDLNGKTPKEAGALAVAWLTAQGRGQEEIRYRLKNWVFSRQRYWGEPIPVWRSYRNKTEGDDEWRQDGARDSGEEIHPAVLPLPDSALPLTLPPFRADLTGRLSPSTPEAATAADVPEVLGGRDEGPSPTVALSRYSEWVWQGAPPSSSLDKKQKGEALGCGPKTYREVCTMPQWAGSSWYHLRFPDPHNRAVLGRPSLLQYWLPVDLYVGGKEHAVTHLIYARFWHKVLVDIGAAYGEEPFKRLITPGVILGTPRHFLLRRKDTGDPVSAANTDMSPDVAASILSAAAAGAPHKTACGVHRASGSPVYAEPLCAVSSAIKQTSSGSWVLLQQKQSKTGNKDGRVAAATAAGEGVEKEKQPLELLTLYEKMSKSKGNTISPDSVFDTHGADVLRLHLMGLGPVASTKMWRSEGLVGAARFLRRIWTMFVPLTSIQSRPLGDTHTASGEAAGPPHLHPLRGVVDKPLTEEERRVLAPLISAVTRSLNHLQVNRAVAALMQGARQLQQRQQENGGLSVSSVKCFLALLHPLAPFITEELWGRLAAHHPNAFRYPGWSLAASGEWPEVGTEGQHLNDMQDDRNDKGEVQVSVQMDGRHRLHIWVRQEVLASPQTLVEAARGASQVNYRIKREENKGRILRRIVAKPDARFVNFAFS